MLRSFLSVNRGAPNVFLRATQGVDLPPEMAAFFSRCRVTKKALVQVADTLLIEEEHFTGPVDSWLASFGEWAESNPDYRCGLTWCVVV